MTSVAVVTVMGGMQYKLGRNLERNLGRRPCAPTVF